MCTAERWMLRNRPIVVYPMEIPSTTCTTSVQRISSANGLQIRFVNNETRYHSCANGYANVQRSHPSHAPWSLSSSAQWLTSSHRGRASVTSPRSNASNASPSQNIFVYDTEKSTCRRRNGATTPLMSARRLLAFRSPETYPEMSTNAGTWNP